MKIITRADLMKMPSGTVFSYYEPCTFTGLYIKDSEPEPDYPDFNVSDLIGAIECNSHNDFSTKCQQMVLGESMPVDFESSGREGLFEDEQLFSIYEKQDVEKLINRLASSLDNK